MNYYQHMLDVQARRRDAVHEREQRELARQAQQEARLVRQTPRLRFPSFIRFTLPRRRKPETPCPSCPEFA